MLATVVRALRPTSARPGDRALILPDGTIEGFVGGACAESSVRLHGLRVLHTGEAVMLRIVPGPERPERPAGEEAAGEEAAQEGMAAGRAAADSTADTGLVTVANPCASGGTLEIFLEGVFPPPLVQVHGDGPIARALAEVGAALGYDMRHLASPVEDSTARDSGGPSPQASTVLADASAVVVAAHGRDEEPVLAAALAAGVAYVALVASRRRGAQVLAALDVPEQAARRVHTPAGLDIGARTVQEIALSIFAEIVAERAAGRSSAAGQPGSAGQPGLGGQPDSAGRPVAAAGQSATAIGEPGTAVDPVCGMTVAVTEATLRLPHDGGMRYFCGSGCKQAFAADPDQYGVGAVPPGRQAG